MEETRKNEAMPHELLLKGRKNLSVSGVKEVISFDLSSSSAFRFPTPADIDVNTCAMIFSSALVIR